jgi:cytosine/adenosine deaminase-related metal-dependent hydrolase
MPVSGPPIADGMITVRDGTIVHVGPRGGRTADVDLGAVAITPGFVNAHTHLDLTAIAGPSFDVDRPMDQVAWLARVVAARREAFASGRGSEDVVRANLKRVIAAGTTAVADIAGGPESLAFLETAPLRGVSCAEVIGLREERARATWAAARAIVDRGPASSRMRIGLSPHAPYSTAAWLYREAARDHESDQTIVATHLAELPAELDLLEGRSGPLRGFLESIGAWDDAWRPAGPSPLDFLSPGPRWLVAHGTYLDLDDLERRASSGLDVTVVYCPRTTAWFGHGPHPYRRLLASRHVGLAIGTDSLASSPSLSVLDELRFLRRLDPDLEAATLLRLGTLDGARAIRIDSVCGTIEPGKSADLAAIALPSSGDFDDPVGAILDTDTKVVATIFEGRFSYGPARRWLKLK